MNNLNTWKLISRSLAHQVPVMLLYVLESHGSSPGRRDFVMAVNAAGEMEGSLGGGIMEYKLVELAKAKMLEQSAQASIHLQVHNKTATSHQSGMICSGEQTILLYPLLAADALTINLIIDCYQEYRVGRLQISQAGIHFSSSGGPLGNPGFQKLSETEWAYSTEIGYTNHLFIIGGGHCSLALSRIMFMMDFYIHLYDDREGLKTMVDNNSVHESRVLEDYSLLSGAIPPGRNSYIVIMTQGYRTDAIALEALLEKDFKYIGVLGSSSKINKMFDDLRSQGVPESRLANINAPIGIPINSHTPEEVAVSIAAEIIRRKNLYER